MEDGASHHGHAATDRARAVGYHEAKMKPTQIKLVIEGEWTFQTCPVDTDALAELLLNSLDSTAASYSYEVVDSRGKPIIGACFDDDEHPDWPKR